MVNYTHSFVLLFFFLFSSSCLQKCLYTFMNTHIIYETTPLPPRRCIHVYKFLFQSKLPVSYQHTNTTLDSVTFKLQYYIQNIIMNLSLSFKHLLTFKFNLNIRSQYQTTHFYDSAQFP